MSLRIESLIESDLQILLAEFDRDRTIPHQGTKGGSREDLLVRFLRKRLAGRFGISSGHLITSDSQWSKQQDIIIYDQFDSPLVEDLGHDKVVFVEAAALTIEVKSTLTRAELKDINDKSIRTRQLARERKFLASHQGMQKPEILITAFAFDSALSVAQINDVIRLDHAGSGIDMLCVLRDNDKKAGFFLTDKSHRILSLPEEGGESGSWAVRKFLFHILLHLQTFSQLALQPDLAAYLNVFGLDKMKRLQTLMTKAVQGVGIRREEVIELIYLTGSLPGPSFNLIQNTDAVFAFEGQQFLDGTMNVEVWTYFANGTRRYVRARTLWEAARRILVDTAIPDDIALMDAVMPYFERLRLENRKLVIKEVLEAKD